MTVRRAFRAAILAFSARAYGGDSYFRAILPALERYGDGVEFSILARDDRYAGYIAGPHVRLVMMPAPAHPAMRALWEQTVLPRALPRLGVDVVFTANNVGLLWSPLPCVIAIRNMEPLAPPSPGMPFRLKVRRAALRALTLASLRRASRVVAVSEFVRETVRALGVDERRIDVVYHGVDDLDDTSSSGPSAGAEAGGEYVAAAAKFARYANLTTLVRAYARMRSLGFGGELRLAGGPHDPTYEREVHSLVRTLGLVPHVKFLGYIPRAQLQRLMRGCRVLLFSSTLEACPFALLEAMHQGAAIVATTAPPMPEICGSAAMYADPLDAGALGDAAYLLATNLEVRQQMAAKARARSEIFRWDRSVHGLIGALRGAAGM